MSRKQLAAVATLVGIVAAGCTGNATPVTDWRSDKIQGPIGLWNGTPYGTFFNVSEWYPAQ
jgi:hypothetical protein